MLLKKLEEQLDGMRLQTARLTGDVIRRARLLEEESGSHYGVEISERGSREGVEERRGDSRWFEDE